MATNPYVNKVMKSDGTTIIDISDSTVTAADLAEGVTAYDASGAKITGGAKRVCYGIHINPSESDPYRAVTYISDAIGMTPAFMNTAKSEFYYGTWKDAFFMPKPCMLKFDGTVDYYLDPNDYTKKADGTASDVANTSYQGNAMMEFPLIYLKFEQGQSDGEGNIYIANYQVDNDFKCYSNYDCDGNVIPYFYTAIYCSGDYNDNYQSLSGLSKCAYMEGDSLGRGVKRVRKFNTTNKIEWDSHTWSDRVTIMAILYIMGKSLNVQETFGYGAYDGNTYIRTGTTNDKGLFWAGTSGTDAVKVLGIEGFWGDAWYHTQGLFVDYNHTTKYKMTYSTVDGSNGNDYCALREESDYYYPAKNNYITAFKGQKSGYYSKVIFGNYGILPEETNGSGTTYYCDHAYFNNSSTWSGTSGNPCGAGGYDSNTSYRTYAGFGIYSYNSGSASLKMYISCKPLLSRFQ